MFNFYSSSLRSFIFVSVFSLLCGSSTVFAHDGEHDAPGAVAPQKGGIVRSAEGLHFELVAKGTDVQIFAFNEDLSSAVLKPLAASVTVALPKKKAQKIEVKENSDHWIFQFDAKGAHRYSVVLTIQKGGESHKISWTVEPKKAGR